MTTWIMEADHTACQQQIACLESERDHLQQQLAALRDAALRVLACHDMQTSLGNRPIMVRQHVAALRAAAEGVRV